ncbi:hypothetical protein BZG02_09290 [Labilibaculum filiforme]|uniref:Tetratricopeptide repeat protein n=2 Tax=Labilibaculum filiforme TaxID=1940526 RepID=A0A2N3HZR0_9BACT|nr:hypothetical protein BZG02_09290 [Labilibaculum filiforme]
MGISIVGNAQMNYIEYHKQVNQAKLQITLENFESALVTYQTVLAQYPKHFYRDIHNACVCAIRCNKWNQALELAKELVLLGYQLEDFKTATFTDFRMTKQWKEIEQKYPELRKQYENSLNPYLYKKYSYMLAEDQRITAMNDFKEHNMAIYEFTSLLKMDYEMNGIPNFVRFKDRLSPGYFAFYRHVYGKVGRCLLSAKTTEDYDFIRRLNSLGIKDLLHREIFKGNLSPRFVITAESYFTNEYGINSEIEIRKDFTNEELSFVPTDKKTYDCIPPYPPIDFVTIDENRKSFGLLPLQQECKLFLAGTWYTVYPFKEIKEALAKLSNKNAESVKKTIQEIESKAIETYSNTLQDDFFLTDYHAYKHSKYIGLDQ